MPIVIDQDPGPQSETPPDPELLRWLQETRQRMLEEAIHRAQASWQSVQRQTEEATQRGRQAAASPRPSSQPGPQPQPGPRQPAPSAPPEPEDRDDDQPPQNGPQDEPPPPSCPASPSIPDIAEVLANWRGAEETVPDWADLPDIGRFPGLSLPSTADDYDPLPNALELVERVSDILDTPLLQIPLQMIVRHEASMLDTIIRHSSSVVSALDGWLADWPADVDLDDYPGLRETLDQFAETVSEIAQAREEESQPQYPFTPFGEDLSTAEVEAALHGRSFSDSENQELQELIDWLHSQEEAQSTGPHPLLPSVQSLRDFVDYHFVDSSHSQGIRANPFIAGLVVDTALALIPGPGWIATAASWANRIAQGARVVGAVGEALAPYSAEIEGVVLGTGIVEFSTELPEEEAEQASTLDEEGTSGDSATGDPGDDNGDEEKRSLRTEHGEERAADPDRPTGQAWNDATDPRSELYFDNETGHYAVRGRNGRTHIFTQEGQHHSTLGQPVTRANALRRVNSGKWTRLRGAARELFNQIIRDILGS